MQPISSIRENGLTEVKALLRFMILSAFLLGVFAQPAASQCTIPGNQVGSGILFAGQCAPVTAIVYYEFVFTTMPPLPQYRIQYMWNDGNTTNYWATVQSRIVAGITVYYVRAELSHTFPAAGLCEYDVNIVLVDNGYACPDSRQIQTVGNWHQDDIAAALGEIELDPDEEHVCEGLPLDNFQFEDATNFACNVQDDATLQKPNHTPRYEQFVYGTNHIAGRGIPNLFIRVGTAQRIVYLTDNLGNEITGPWNVNPVTGALVTPYNTQSGYFEGPIVEIPVDAVTGVYNLNETYPISFDGVGTVTNDQFEVTLRNWNVCNPWNGSQTAPNAEIANLDESIILIVDGPLANAGPDDAICASETFNTNGVLVDGVSALWTVTSSGYGSFTNATSPGNATFTPGSAAIAQGYADLILHAYGTGDCPEHTDTMRLVLTPIPPTPTISVSSGSASFCDNNSQSVTLRSSESPNGSYLWRRNGTSTGITSREITLNDYTHSGDYTVTVYSISPVCPNTSLPFTVAIDRTPTATVGPIQTLCNATTANLAGNTSGTDLTASGYGEWTFINNLVWQETFSESPDNSTSGAQWTTSGITPDADTYFNTLTRRIAARDLDAEAVWRSNVIPITSVSPINASVYLIEGGDLENQDYIRVYYRLNGGSETLFPINGDNSNDFGNRTARVSGLTGTSFQIIIRCRNNDPNEYFYIDNLEVRSVPALAEPAITSRTTATSAVSGLWPGDNRFRWSSFSNRNLCDSVSAIYTIRRDVSPDPAAAGSNQTFCETATATMTATAATNGGTGTWSLVSGSGSASQPNNPLSPVTGLGYGANVFRWTVTSALGICPSSSSTVTLTRNPNPLDLTGNTTIVDNVVCYNTPGQLQITGSEANVRYYLRTGGVDISSVHGTGGLITLTTPNLTSNTTFEIHAVKDVTNCDIIFGSFTINVNNQFTLAQLYTSHNICSGYTTTISVTLTGGTGPYDIVWNDGTNHTINNYVSGTNITAGPYSATTNISLTSVVDDNICAPASLGNPITITVGSTPLTATLTGPDVCLGTSSTITVAVNGGVSPYDYTINGTVYNDLPSGYTFDLGPLSEGTHTYDLTEVRDNCGNPVPSGGLPLPLTIQVNEIPTISGTTSVCVNSTTTLTSSVTGGTWSSATPTVATVNPATGVVTGISAGTSVITYTAPTTCWATTTVTVNDLPSPTASNNGPVCAGTTLSLTGGPSGMNSYSWSGPDGFTSSEQSPTVSTDATTAMSGIYTLTVTNSNLCSSSATTTATVNPLPAAITGITSVCVNSTTTLSSTTPGGSWSSSNTAIATINSSGTVTGISDGSVTITYQLPTTCFVTTIITVNALPTPIATNNGPVCAGETLTLTGGPSGMNSYSWTGPNGFNSSQQNPTVSTSATAAMAGSYNLTVTNSNSCSATTTTSATVNPLPAAITGTTSVCVNSTTNLNNATAGGTWSSSNTSIATVNSSNGLVTGVSAGNVTITYTLPTTCSVSTTVTVNALPIPAATNNGPVCVGSSLSLAGEPSGMNSYSWSGPNGYSSSLQSPTISSSATLAMAGTYTLTVTNSNSCSGSATTSVTVNPPPSAITGTTNICVNSTTTLSNATSGGTWSSEAPGTATVNSSGVVTGISAGTAVIRYTLPTSCYVTTTVTVTGIPDPPALTGTTSICGEGTTAYFYTIGDGSYYNSGNEYHWTIPTDAVRVNGGTLTDNFVILRFPNPGTYVLSVDENTVVPVVCSGDPESLTIYVNEKPVPDAGTDVTICQGESTTLGGAPSASGGSGTYTYSWLPTYALNDPTAANPVATPLFTMTYQLTVTDIVTGCVSETPSQVTVTVQILNGTASITTPVTCNGGSGAVTMTSSGGTAPISYTFNGVTNTTGLFPGIPAGGPYLWSITDANNCGPVTGSLVVNQPPAINGSASITSPVVCVGGTGSVRITGAGGTPPLSFTFNGVTNTTGIFNGISAGVDYPWSITDANSCGPVTGTLTMTEPAAITGSASVTSPVSCNGGTATVTLTGSGGTAPLSYTFNGTTNSTGVFSGVPAGMNFPWSINDVYSCGPYTGTLTVTQPLVVSGSASVTTPIQCNGGTATVTLTGSGGTSPLSYTFNGVTNATGIFTGIYAGAGYVWSITDANSCGPVTGTLTVMQPTAITGSVSVSPILCNGGTATVSINGSGGTPPLSYTFNGITNGTGIFSGIPAGGPYSWSITDNYSCGPYTGTQTIIQPTALNGSATITSPILCNGGTATVTLSGTGGTAPLSYTFNGVTNTTGVFTGIAAGAGYAWSITDANSCGPVTGTLPVTQPAILAGSASVTSPIACFGGTATITLTANGGTAPISYTFNGITNSTGTFTGVLAGAGYAWSITDVNSCGPVTGTLTVAQPTILSGSSSITTPILCNGGTATVTLTGSGGTAPLSYTFNGVTNGTGVFTGIPAGAAYTWSITDANNCGPVSGNQTVTQPAILTGSASATAIYCNGGTATVTLSGSGGIAPLSYTFNGVTNTTGIFTGVPAGAGYAWSITDANTCGPVTGTVTVTEPTAITGSASVTTPIICNGGTATVTVTGTGGTAPLSYSFNGVTNGTGIFAGIPAGGPYNWSITDIYSCTPATGTLTIAQPDAVSGSASVTIPIPCNGGTATVTLTGSGGTAPLSYTFNGVTNGTGVFAGIPAGGGYSWSITDANSCGPVTGTLPVTQPAALSGSSSVTSPVQCNGGTATVTLTGSGGTAPLSYTFNGITNATGVFTGVPAGVSYSWSITDANSCGPVTGTQTVTEPTAVTGSASITTPILCNGGTATITLSGSGGTAPLSYTFNGVTNATGVFTGIFAGAGYAWSITDANSCGPVTGTLPVAEPTAVTGSASVTSPILCYGGTATVTLTGSGGTAPLSYTFNGVTNGTGVFAGIPAGAGYSWSVTDANSCGPVTGTLPVAQPTAVTGTASVTSPILCNGGTATVTLTGSGGTAPLSYTFNGITNATGVFTGIPAGVAYSWSITDANSCGPVTGTQTVTEPTSVTGTAAITLPILCNGGTATVTLSGSGGTAPLSYTFNGVTNTTGVFSGIIAGAGYAWSITDANNCGPITGTLPVPQPEAVTGSASITSPVLCSGGTATITLTGSGGTGPLSYTFNGVTNATGTFTGILAGGPYSWSITDANYCGPVTGTLTVTQPTTVVGSASITTPILCNGGTATITLTGSGGTAPLSYTFNGVTNGTGVFTGIPAGAAYTWSITDANGCGPVTGNLTVTQPAAITGSALATTILCNGGTTTVTLSGSGGTAPLSYTFNGVTNATGIFTGIPAGVGYAWSITDANTCGPVTGTLTIVEPGIITGGASVTTPILCNGGTATVTVTGSGGTAPLSYRFNGVTNSTGIFAGIPAGGPYNWSVTDMYSCTPASGTLTVAQPDIVTGSASVTTPIACNGGTATVTLTGSGGTAPLSFTFNGVTNGTGIFAGIPAGGGYSWSITDANSCGPVTGTLPVTQPAVLTGSSSVTSPVQCNGGTATVRLTASGGTTPYSYTFDGVTNTTGIFNGITAGLNYPWSITDANSCGPVTGTQTVTEPTVLTGSASITTPILCNGGTAAVTLSGSGGTAPLSYTFNGVTNTTGVFSGILEGAGYAWSITDANGCGPVTGTLPVTEPTAVTGSASVTIPIACYGGTATVTLTGSGGTAPLSYTFNGVTNTTGVFTGIYAGAGYSWSVTDANGCGPVTGILPVAQPDAVTGSASVTIPIICNGGTATVTLTGSGGTAPLSYTFNGVTNSTGVFTGITAGVAYAWSITDANSCGPVTGSLTITQPMAITGTAMVVSPILCNGGTAIVTINGSGGTAPLSYTFNGVTNATGVFTGIPAGAGYSWSITDANSCGPLTGTLPVVEPAKLTIDNITSPEYNGGFNVRCNSGSDGSAVVTVSGGTGSYYYSWYSDAALTVPIGQIMPTAINLQARTYFVRVWDMNNCADTASITLIEPAALDAAITEQTNVDCYGYPTGSATVTANPLTGTPPFEYSINGGSTWNTDGIFNNLVAMTYTVIVRDANGCTKPVPVTINQPTMLTATLTGVTNVSCYGGNDGIITVSATSGAGVSPYEYSIDGGTSWDPSGIFTSQTAGSYNIIVRDANGCTVNIPAFVTEPQALQLTTTPDVALDCYNDKDGTGTFYVMGGTWDYSFTEVSNTADAVFSAPGFNSYSFGSAGAGIVVVGVTDAKGCYVQDTIRMTQPSVLTPGSIQGNQVLCPGEDPAQITEVAPATGGPTSIYYQWQSAYSIAGPFFNIGGATQNEFTPPSGAFNTLYYRRMASSGICPPVYSDTVVVEIDKPVAMFTVDNSSGCQPLAVNFTNSSSGYVSAHWYFGDGAESTDINTSHIYSNPGPSLLYAPARLDVTSVNGCTSTIENTITVYPEITSDFTLSSDTVCSGESVMFTTLPGAFQYHWIYGDGMDEYGSNVNDHDYVNTTDEPYTYWVTLRAESFFGCESETTLPVVVYPTPAPAFIAFPVSQVIPNSTVTFTNTTLTKTWDWLWRFGNGNTSTLESPVYTYGISGNFAVTLIADNGICADSVTHSISILPAPPVASFDSIPSGCAPWSVIMNNTSLYATSYFWDFGDGHTSSAENPSYTYLQSGTYLVTLYATGPGGMHDTTRIVHVYPSPLAYFEVSPPTVYVNDEKVRLFNLSVGGDYFVWEFGDGDTSHVRDPFHKYTSEGVYDITLHAYSSNGCYDTYIASPAVTVIPFGEIIFATVFKPNPDGPIDIDELPSSGEAVDQFFYPPIRETVLNYHLQIFNRWGTLIFESYDINKPWNGYYRNKRCPQGVYVWYVEGKYANGRPFNKVGDITLLH